MRNIAKIKENDRKALFHNTAAKMGMTDAIIGKEKRFSNSVGTVRNDCRVKHELLNADIKDSVFVAPWDNIILYDHDLGE